MPYLHVYHLKSYAPLYTQAHPQVLFISMRSIPPPFIYPVTHFICLLRQQIALLVQTLLLRCSRPFKEVPFSSQLLVGTLGKTLMLFPRPLFI